jgi:catechol 2,3-dioxygenase-like lactoylglutathione lyase family enzyme
MATLLLSGLSLASNAWAQAPPRTAKPGVIAARGAFFALSVADLDASSRWYTEKLGLEVVMSLPKANGIAVKVLGGGGLTVELIQQDGAVQASCGTGEPACLGMFKAGVLVKDLDKTLKSLAARGVQPALGPFPARPDQPANAIIRDNAGNLIQILEDSRPQSGS